MTVVILPYCAQIFLINDTVVTLPIIYINFSVKAKESHLKGVHFPTTVTGGNQSGLLSWPPCQHQGNQDSKPISFTFVVS